MNKKLFLSLFVSILLIISAKNVQAGDPGFYIETSTGKNTVCAGLNISLTGRSNVSYYTITEHRWESSTPGIIAATKDQFAFINTRETGIHNITYTVSDERGNTYSTQISVKVLELPDNNVLINQNDSYELNEIQLPAELSAREHNSDYEYQWFRNNIKIEGATSSWYKANKEGSYRLMTISDEGCNSYSSVITMR